MLPEENCRFSAVKLRCETEVSLSISLSKLEVGLSERLGMGSVAISSWSCEVETASGGIEVVVLEVMRAGESFCELKKEISVLKFKN